jgi:hypothetical protein
MEAAAAGRLVISTPVGRFPYMHSLGAGIEAPLDPDAYTLFVTERLTYYSESPAEYIEGCKSIQETARRFD